MILEFTKTTSVYEADAYINVNGEETIIKDLMITNYVPTNFVGTPKNFTLGEEHPDWEILHLHFEQKILQEWLIELDYDPTKYYVDNATHKIINRLDAALMPNKNINPQTPSVL